MRRAVNRDRAEKSVCSCVFDVFLVEPDTTTVIAFFGCDQAETCRNQKDMAFLGIQTASFSPSMDFEHMFATHKTAIVVDYGLLTFLHLRRLKIQVYDIQTC